MLASPIAIFPKSPHFSLPLVSQIQSTATLLKETRGPKTSNFTACGLGTLATECFIACMQTAQKLHPSAVTHETLKQPQTPGI